MIILARGYGTRLARVARGRHKTLELVGEHTILGRILRELRTARELRRRRQTLPEQRQLIHLQPGLLQQLTVRGLQGILTRINVAAGQAPPVRVNPGIAVAQRQQRPLLARRLPPSSGITASTVLARV